MPHLQSLQLLACSSCSTAASPAVALQVRCVDVCEAAMQQRASCCSNIRQDMTASQRVALRSQPRAGLELRPLQG
jgi:hypothetical protein